ncbi:hypothetical protein [Sphingopyxis sp.]|jgi:hypothetical protein|uniref:hypothetical protein n=1 Tax=Sphingopyxis sp. TaxID=1908224 RepID=UPI003F722337
MDDGQERLPPVADLAGKTILLSAPKFFGYETEIAEELRRRGASVDFLADRPFRSPAMHLLARVWRSLILLLTDRYYRRQLKSFGTVRYDYVLIVNGQTLSHRLLDELRAAHRSATFLFYLWDSLENRASALALLRHFDRASCFEPEAAKRRGLRFRPLFYCPAFDGSASEGENAGSKYAVSFLGTAHTDRYAIVSQIDRQLPAHITRFWFLYLQAKWVLLAYRLLNRGFRGARQRDFSFNPMDRQASSQIFWQSDAILDIEHPRQVGLTMRTFETLGAGKKLITTNADVRNYAFFDAANVCVIDRNNPSVPAAFLEKAATPVSEATRKRYSLAGWVDEIFAEEDFSSVHLRESR